MLQCKINDKYIENLIGLDKRSVKETVFAINVMNFRINSYYYVMTIEQENNYELLIKKI